MEKIGQGFCKRHTRIAPRGFASFPRSKAPVWECKHPDGFSHPLRAMQAGASMTGVMERELLGGGVFMDG
jgi:hypothetical protein